MLWLIATKIFFSKIYAIIQVEYLLLKNERTLYWCFSQSRSYVILEFSETTCPSVPTIRKGRHLGGLGGPWTPRIVKCKTFAQTDLAYCRPTFANKPRDRRML